MVDTCQLGASSGNLKSCLAHFRNNMTIEERRTTKILAKDALIEMSLSKWPSFMKAL